MDSVLEAERTTLKLRLLAIAAIVAGLYSQQQVLQSLGALVVLVAFVTIYLGYTLSLHTLILPRIQTPLVIYPMIVIDVLCLLVAMHFTGGLSSGAFILFPILIIFYAIHRNYSSSFFAATVIGFGLGTYTLLNEANGIDTSGIVSLQIPALFLLAYFSGFLARRSSEEKERERLLQEIGRTEQSVHGLRDVVRVFGRTLEVYEDWAQSGDVVHTPEKEAIEKLHYLRAMDGQYALAHFAFGKIFAESGQLSRAEEALQRALELDPKLLDAFRELSQVLVRQGRFEEAIRPALQYANGAQNDWVAHQNLAVIYHELDMADNSRAAEARALAVSSDSDRDALALFFRRLRSPSLEA